MGIASANNLVGAGILVCANNAITIRVRDGGYFD